MHAVFALGVALGCGLLAANPAAAKPCSGDHPKYLDFRDYGTNPDRCAWVEGTNANWATFQGDWNNKADYFKNNGKTHNVCVYDKTEGWVNDDTAYMMYIGDSMEIPNLVSSNWWTKTDWCWP
jgi:hypothetical protein